METYASVMAVLVGLTVGSFLNVVIWRLPRGGLFEKRRSHCPRCDAAIAWRDNLPLVSWLRLGGRCRACRAPISVRYPLVEALTGALFLLAHLARRPDLPGSALLAAFLAALVAISFIDLDHRIIPDRITKPGILLAVALAPWSGLHPPDWIAGTKPALSALLHAGAGAAVGAGVVLAIRAVGSWILKKEAMGLGDVKLLGLIGGVVGPLQVLYALSLGCLAGALIGGLMFAWGRRRPMGCVVTVRGPGGEARFARARVVDGCLLLAGPADLEVGHEVRLGLVLPAAKILEEQDAHMDLRGRVVQAQPARWQIEVLDATPDDRARLEAFAWSYRYIPFGPFLALGGALTALYGTHVQRFIAEDYPRLARSLFE